MDEPVIAQRAPYVKETTPGTYYWCRCGRSKSQPFCDSACHNSPEKIGPIYNDVIYGIAGESVRRNFTRFVKPLGSRACNGDFGLPGRRKGRMSRPYMPLHIYVGRIRCTDRVLTRWWRTTGPGREAGCRD